MRIYRSCLLVRQGQAGCALAWFGEEPLSRRIGLMVDCCGKAGHGKARLGEAGLGLAGSGEDVFYKRKYRMKFNIDVSNLSCGDVVEQSQCEQIIGFTRNEDMYGFQFAVMQLSEHVQRLLWAGGKQFTVVTENGSIRVLTHEEASKYNAARFDGAIAKMRRCHKRLTAVDCGEFDSETKTNHMKSILKSSRILTAIKSTRASVEVKEHVSIVPKRFVKG